MKRPVTTTQRPSPFTQAPAPKPAVRNNTHPTVSGIGCAELEQEWALPLDTIDLNDHIAYLIRRVQQLHVNLWRSQVSTQITSPQFAVLNTVARNPQLDQKTLSNLASLDRSTVADVVARLCQRGYILRTRDPQDERRNLLVLTPAGEEALAPLLVASQAMSQVLLGSLRDDQREHLKDALMAILETEDSTAE